MTRLLIRRGHRLAEFQPHAALRWEAILNENANASHYHCRVPEALESTNAGASEQAQKPLFASAAEFTSSQLLLLLTDAQRQAIAQSSDVCEARVRC